MKSTVISLAGVIVAVNCFDSIARASSPSPLPELVVGHLASREYTAYSEADHQSLSDQVISINQFSDVYPTDWAYQALSNLVERYGCVAGFPNGTFAGGTSITRYEAAAILSACLDRVTEITDETKRLIDDFSDELAALKGRTDILERKVAELEATQFSTTTKLSGIATMVLGSNAYFGSNGGITQVSDGRQIATGGGYKQAAQALQGAMSFNYDVQLKLSTSFTGKDALITVLRSGNFQDSPYGGQYGVNDVTNSFVGLNQLAVQFQEPSQPNVVEINRLFYQFPISKNFTATIGGLVRQDDMLAFWPSAYTDNAILNFFAFSGAPGAYNLNLGSGVGLWWSKEKISASFNYVAANGAFGNPTTNIGCSSDPSFSGVYTPDSLSGGILTCASSQTMTFQLAYQDKGWGLAAAYTNSSGNRGATWPQGAIASGTPYAVNPQILRTVQNWSRKSFNSFSLAGYWQPSKSGWLPSISVGWGINQAQPITGIFGYNSSDVDQAGLGQLGDIYSVSWSVGFVWNDVLISGNSAGMAFGQPTFVTSSYRGNRAASPGSPSPVKADDAGWAWEWWYNFQVTDNISVTPAIFYLSRPLGQITSNVGSDWYSHKTFSNLGAIVKTTFRF